MSLKSLMVGTEAVGKGKGKEIGVAQENKGQSARPTNAEMRRPRCHASPELAAASAPAPTATVKMNWLASTSAVLTNHIRSGCCSRM